jgi:hypothetical protein
MCDRCADIDYPIGDVIWLPCGGPAWRYNNPSYRHTPRRRPDDTKEIELLAGIFRELSRSENQKPQTGFEGVE